MAKKGKNATGNRGGQLNNTNAVTWTEAKAMELAIDLLQWYKDDAARIFFQEFLLERDLYKDSVAFLSEKYESFSAVIKQAKQWQEVRLAKWGVYGKTNPAVTIFMLTNHHGYRNEFGLRHSVQKAGTEQLAEPELDSEITRLVDVLGVETAEVIKELEGPTNGHAENGEKEVKK